MYWFWLVLHRRWGRKKQQLFFPNFFIYYSFIHLFILQFYNIVPILEAILVRVYSLVRKLCTYAVVAFQMDPGIHCLRWVSDAEAN